jgi:hypothetical protein
MRLRPISFLGALVLLAALFPSGLAASSTPAVSFTGLNASDTFPGGAFSLGFEFSTNSAIDVTALGFFDADLVNPTYVGLDDCTGCGEVGIYNSTGTLLVSTTVTTSGTQVGDFIYATVPTTLLAAGQDYFIVAETGNSTYTFDTTGFSVNPNIDYIQDAYTNGASLAFPTDTDDITAADGGGIFGPNFEETAATSPVPEPASVSLVALALGLVAFCANRKRSLKTTRFQD